MRISGWIASLAAGVLVVASSAAHAAPPAKGENITGKTVYVTAGSWLRYSDALISRVYTTTKATLEVKGRGSCTNRLCPVTHNGVELWALLGRLDVAKPSGPIETERTLRPGATGEDVKIMQTALVKKGYQLKVDGKYGSATTNAVRDFQKKSGIGADGNIGKDTRGKLSV